MNGASIGLRLHQWTLVLLLSTALYGTLAGSSVEAQNIEAGENLNAASQSSGIPQPGSAPPAANDESHKNGQGHGGAFVIAPLPIFSPALGTGVVPVLSYIFPTGMRGKVSSASVIGAVGLVTDNGTRALALGGDIYLRQDAYRFTTIYCRGNLNLRSIRTRFGRFAGKASPRTGRSTGAG